MKILVDARISAGKHGGIEQFLISFAQTIHHFPPQFEFVWLMLEGETDWIEEYLDKNSSLVCLPHFKNRGLKKYIRRFLDKIPHLNEILRRIKYYFRFSTILPNEPKEIKIINPDIIHFTNQSGFRTNRPNIYHPHDLQHKHFPNFFSKSQLRFRECMYREMSAQASVITLGNEWTLNDFAANYPEFKNKLINIPLALRPFSIDSEPPQAQDDLGIFFLYPAAVWPHKNHELLLLAFSKLHLKYPHISLVLTGPRTDKDKKLDSIIRKLNLKDSVIRLGYVDSNKLSHLYKTTVGVVIPSLFESASYPVWEAFLFGTPVAVSNVTSIPSQVADCALLFDPTSDSEIYESMEFLLVNRPLSLEIADKGRKRVKLFDYKNSAQGFEVAYCMAAGTLENLSFSNWSKTKSIF